MFVEKKKERAATASGGGVGEAVPDQHRANSLNTGWVKVPVKFPALAVIDSEENRVKTLATRRLNSSTVSTGRCVFIVQATTRICGAFAAHGHPANRWQYDRCHAQLKFGEGFEWAPLDPS